MALERGLACEIFPLGAITSWVDEQVILRVISFADVNGKYLPDRER